VFFFYVGGEDGWGLRRADTGRAQIKYLRLPEELIDTVKEQQQAQTAAASRGRGGFQRGGRGRGGQRGGRGGQRGRG
jgi:hypothetical protein